MPRIDQSIKSLFINVRNLVEHLIPSTFNQNIDLTPRHIHFMQQGQVWHSILQTEFMKLAKSDKELYCTCEAFVSDTLHLPHNWKGVIRGRLDGLFYNKKAKEYTLIEIKTINDLFYDGELRENWRLQTLFYLWLFINQAKSSRDKIHEQMAIPKEKLDLTPFRSNTFKGEVHVVNPLTQERWKITVEYSFSEIRDQIYEAFNKALTFYKRRIDHMELFRTITKLPWFFDEYRPGQHENLQKLRQKIRDKRIALVTAPPGAGKTALVLKTLLELAIINQKQVFYSSSKNTQQIEAIHILRRLNAQLDSPLWIVVLTARENYCLNESTCNPQTCDYYQNMNKNPVHYAELFESNPICDVVTLKNLAGPTNRFCPYYQSKQMAGYADIVIGDQNYQFSPEARLGLLTRQKHPLLFSKRDLPFYYIIDEAHNLGPRLRNLLTSQLDISWFEKEGMRGIQKLKLDKLWILRLAKLLNYMTQFFKNLPTISTPSFETSLKTAFDLLNSKENDDLSNNESLLQMKYHSDEGDHWSIKITKKEINDLDSILSLHNIAILELEKEFISKVDLYQIMLPFLQEWTEILNTVSELKIGMEKTLEEVPQYQLFYQHGNNIKLEAFCLDVSPHIKKVLEKTPGTIVMSATLYPEHFFRMLFDLNKKEASYIELKNYFPIKNRQTLLLTDFNTRFNERPENLLKFAKFLEKLQSIKPGNYLIFLPNLELMKFLQIELSKLLIPALTQDTFMKDSILTTSANNMYLCALGSILSEGVNISGLTGVIIFSPGVLPPSYRRNLLQEYYKLKIRETSKEQSFNLAYLIPGMIKVLQAAGRLHRSPNDKGIIYLVGQRFQNSPYYEFIPQYLQPIEKATLSNFHENVNKFWGESIHKQL